MHYWSLDYIHWFKWTIKQAKYRISITNIIILIMIFTTALISLGSLGPTLRTTAINNTQKYWVWDTFHKVNPWENNVGWYLQMYHSLVLTPTYCTLNSVVVQACNWCLLLTIKMWKQRLQVPVNQQLRHRHRSCASFTMLHIDQIRFRLHIV